MKPSVTPRPFAMIIPADSVRGGGRRRAPSSGVFFVSVFGGLMFFCAGWLMSWVGLVLLAARQHDFVGMGWVGLGLEILTLQAHSNQYPTSRQRQRNVTHTLQFYHHPPTAVMTYSLFKRTQTSTLPAGTHTLFKRTNTVLSDLRLKRTQTITLPGGSDKADNRTLQAYLHPTSAVLINSPFPPAQC